MESRLFRPSPHASAAPLSPSTLSLPSSRILPLTRDPRHPRHLLTPPDTDQDDDGFHRWPPPRDRSPTAAPLTRHPLLLPPLNSDSGSLDNVNNKMDGGRLPPRTPNLEWYGSELWWWYPPSDQSGVTILLGSICSVQHFLGKRMQ